MISNLTPASQLLVSDLSRIQQQVADLNTQISSGKKINVASDAPSEVESLLQLRTNQTQNQQISSNLAQAKTDAQSADSALAGAATLLDTAVRLAAQGASDTQTADTRASLVPQVESVFNQMVAYSQTQVGGRYIFSGDQDGSPTYQVDYSAANGAADEHGAANGVDELSAAAATRQIENPGGGSFAGAKTAHEIFNDTNADGTPAADNVFAALNALRTGLLTNDPTAIRNAADNLKLASDHISSMAAFYGSLENRIQDASSFAGSYGTRLQTEISQKEDADPASAAVALTEATTKLQAAMTMQGHTPHSTLFDFLG